MTDLRDALLKQNPQTSVEKELELLDGLVRTEERRAQRLTWWTLVVWGMWIAIFVVSFVVYLALAKHPPIPPQGAAAPATQPTVVQASSHGGIGQALVLVTTTLMLLATLLLPAVGVVLLILMILSRRSASTTRIRVSLASIDAQLRLLTTQRNTPPAGSSAPDAG